MRTAARLYRDRHRTSGALLCHRFGVFGLLQAIHRPDKEENCTRDNQKIDDQRDKIAVIPGNSSRFGRVRRRVKRN